MNQSKQFRIGQSPALDIAHSDKDCESSVPAKMDVTLYIGIPAEIRTLLSAPAANYGAACDVGTLCAALLVNYLRTDPAMTGSNRVGAVATRMSALGCDGGYLAGFFSTLEHLMIEGAKHVNVDAIATQKIAVSMKVRQAGAKEDGGRIEVGSTARGRRAKTTLIGVSA
jgi:hypothetical protein